jgi:hypothetical protein
MAEFGQGVSSDRLLPVKAVSEREKELQGLLATEEHLRLQSMRVLLEQMSRQGERRVIFTSYPACNSEG